MQAASFSSFEANSKKFGIISVIAVVASTLLVAYLVVSQGQSMVMWGLVAAILFLLCFFSVRLSLFALIFSMLLSPEVAMGNAVQRAVTIRAEDILLSIMTLAWLLRVAIIKDVGVVRKNALNRPIIGFCLILTLSTLNGAFYGNIDYKAGFFFTLKLIEYFFLFYIIVNYIHEKKEINQFFNALLLVTAIICIYSLFQILTGGDVAAPFEGSRGERNTLGGFLVLMGSITAGVLLHTESPREKGLLSVLLILIFVVILFSISRSSWIASLVVLFVLFRQTKRNAMFFAIVTLILIALPFFLPEVVRNRLFFTFFQNAAPGQQISVGGIRLDTSTSARFFSAQGALSAIIQHPFLGWGITGWNFLDGQYFRNLAEFGIIGSAAFFWLLFAAHRTIKEAITIDAKGRLHGLMIGFYAGFWGICTHALGANSFIIVRIAEPFWCLMGLTIVYLSFHNEIDVPPALSDLDKKTHNSIRSLPWRAPQDYIKQ